MKSGLLSLVLVVSLYFSLAFQASAILFLPAVVLIPIANIVAWIIGGSLLPGLGIGLIWHKMFGKSLLGSMIGVLISLILLGLGTAAFLYFQNPARPFF